MRHTFSTLSLAFSLAVVVRIHARHGFGLTRRDSKHVDMLPMPFSLGLSPAHALVMIEGHGPVTACVNPNRKRRERVVCDAVVVSIIGGVVGLGDLDEMESRVRGLPIAYPNGACFLSCLTTFHTYRSHAQGGFRGAGTRKARLAVHHPSQTPDSPSPASDHRPTRSIDLSINQSIYLSIYLTIDRWRPRPWQPPPEATLSCPGRP